MTLIRFARCIIGLATVLSSGQILAQTPSDLRAAFTESRRQEVLKALRSLTRDTFPEVLSRAQAGDVEAQVIVGMAYTQGSGVEKDSAAAERWTRTAAENRHPMGQNSLGLLYQTGAGVPRDDVKAVAWFRHAAAQGYAQAQSNLGWAYYTGQGVEASAEEAIPLFRLAAEQGNASAQNRLGVAHAQGKGVSKDAREAVSLYRKAAEQGEVLAQRNLAQMYNYGTGTPRDYGQAALWYRKAAEQGDPGAQLDLAVAYVKGEGVPKDKDEAEKWLKKSSEQGYAIGSYFYGQLYLEKRHSLAVLVAVDQFALSAAQGYPYAAYRLGLLRASRLSPNPIGKDDMAACKWYVIASILDRPGTWETQRPEEIAEMRRDLPGRIEKIRKSLGPEKSAACDRAASEWLTAHPGRR